VDFIRCSFIILLFWLGGCAKFSYLLKQGVGQIRLISGGRLNKELINDSQTDPKVKNKLKKIEQYKNFFYSYFSKNKTEIYSKTILLDRDAVSYLLTLSPYDRIKAKEECFPVVGCFPYIGFFKFDDAKKYAQNGSNIEMRSYIRPVYAYSTLGNFNDRILSSFFRYDNFDLAELIFHEIFHTIFFVKDEVSLNENLAGFFAEELTKIYFKDDLKYGEEKEEEKIKQTIFSHEISQGVQKLNGELRKQEEQKKARLSKLEADHVIEDFLKKELEPGLKKACVKASLSQGKCVFNFKDWNSARLAAFGTYNSGQEKIENFFIESKLTLKQYLELLEKEYEIFKKEKNKSDNNFENYFYQKND